MALRLNPDYRDPLIRILTITRGHGERPSPLRLDLDTLTLECGHTIVRRHITLHPLRTSCHLCRVWTKP